MAKPQEKVSFVERLKQIGQVFSFTAKQDKWFVPLVIAAVAIPVALTVLVVLLGWGPLWIPVGILLTLLAVLIVLNLRSNTAMMNVAEGQPGRWARVIRPTRRFLRRSRQPEGPVGGPASPQPSTDPAASR